MFFFFQHGFFKPYGPKKAIFPSFFHDFFGLFSKYLAASAAKYRKKGGPLQKLARGDRQTHFGTFNFWFKTGFVDFLLKKLNFQAVIKSAASAASPILSPSNRGGCASSRLDHSLKV